MPVTVRNLSNGKDNIVQIIRKHDLHIIKHGRLHIEMLGRIKIGSIMRDGDNLFGNHCGRYWGVNVYGADFLMFGHCRLITLMVVAIRNVKHLGHLMSIIRK